MERRELLSLGGVAAIAGAFGVAEKASAQAAPAAGKKVIRIYADADGNSHVQEVPISTKSGRVFHAASAVPATQMIYADYQSSSTEDWHRTPARQFSVSLSGEIEVEVSGGVKHAIHAGDIVFLEDLQGKGHVTHILTPVTNLFVRVADGFDLLAWAKGEG